MVVHAGRAGRLNNVDVRRPDVFVDLNAYLAIRKLGDRHLTQLRAQMSADLFCQLPGWVSSHNNVIGGHRGVSFVPAR